MRGRLRLTSRRPAAAAHPQSGDDALTSRRFQFGLGTVIALVALRVGVGWHFFQEGLKKLDPGFTAVAFLGQAVGPLAPLYHQQTPPYYQKYVLLYPGIELEPEDRDPLSYKKELDELRWTFEDAVGDKEQYGIYEWPLDGPKYAAAYAAYNDAQAELEQWFADNAADIDEFRRDLAFYHKLRKGEGYADISSHDGDIARYEKKVKDKIGPWLRQFDAIRDGLESKINEIADPDEPEFRATHPDRTWVDDTVAWWTLVAGGLLVLGLFTRISAAAAFLFLLAVMLAQPPWVAGAQPIYYQFVEGMALLVLIGTAAGRYAGLDFFLYALGMKCCPPKQTGQESEDKS